MKIEKVSNGYVVEVEVAELDVMTSTIRQWGTKKSICPDLIQLLNFINAHYGNEEAQAVVMKDD